ncbi:MAG: YdcH family protein [Proteobacteria bacterium]|nr:YdcH family protein [Pseudomonadota bacterium]MBS0463024.1 YdcH family protein [Pseudomonadota bacterium]MBS0465452.1 YdcH family protein [Pseudomonadota bacterium]
MFESQSRDELDTLLKSDIEFRQLYHRHRELDKQVMDAELGVLPLDDITLAQMKREKLHAKDRLTHMFETKRAH